MLVNKRQTAAATQHQTPLDARALQDRWDSVTGLRAYVIAGEVVVRSETQTYTARQGAVVEIPKGGAIHCFRNESAALAHLLCVVVPTGLDEFFAEIGQPVTAGQFLPKPNLGPEDLKKPQAIAAQRGQEVFPPDYLTKKEQ